VEPGDLFLARIGPRSDGRDHIADAVRRGAAVVAVEAELLEEHRAAAGAAPLVEVRDLAQRASEIAERFYGWPSRDLALVGVTGTNGKTTVAHLAAELLRRAGVQTGTVGTLGAELGGERFETGLTTPGAVETSRLLAKARDGGDRAVVLETSSHALEQGRVRALRFGVGVFTNLSRDHLDDHGTMDAYAAAKARLFDELPADALAIVNADDRWHQRMLRGSGCGALRCSQALGDATVSVRRSTLDGLELVLRGPWGEAEAAPRLIGEFHAMNALQAFAAALETLRRLGEPADPERLARDLAGLSGAPGRMERVIDRPAVFVDYAHTPAALEAALRALRPLLPSGGRLVCVFGCGGDRDRGKRPAMGRVVSELADVAVITSDNPRREEPCAIIGEVVGGMSGGAERIVHCDRATAIGFAVANASRDDIVIIAGKGHETYQLLPDGAGGVRRIDFDDREQARAAHAQREGAMA
jgi:UDP-N-acetylmuramoyl-L-alanyl-D-glutamate--2,6-diaminopimelate ligase